MTLIITNHYVLEVVPIIKDFKDENEVEVVSRKEDQEAMIIAMEDFILSKVVNIKVEV